MRRIELLAISAVAVLAAACQEGAVRDADTLPEARRLDMDNPAVINTQLGVGYLRQGNLELALAKLQKAVRLDPSLASAHNALALLYERLGKTELAGEQYAAAVRLDGDDSAAHNNYGQFLCKQGHTREAEEQFLAAVANPLYQTPYMAYSNAGVCARREPDLEKAETYLRKALTLAPRFAPALVEMAHLSVDRKEYLQGRAFLQRYLAEARPTPETLWLGIQIESNLGNQDAVASYSLLLKNNYPDSEEARQLRKWEKYER